MKLTGNTIFITGGGSGIGRGLAEAFHKLGNQVVISGRRRDRLQAVIEANPGMATIDLDITDPASIKAAAAALIADYPALNVLINNAGLSQGLDPIDKGSYDDWDTMIDTNIKGLLYVSKIVANWMKDNKTGHIINLGSIAGKEVYPNGNVYCATKAAVDTLGKAMRVDLVQHGIKVTTIDPGAVETEFSEVRFKGDKERAKKVYEGFDPLVAQDIAETIWFVVSRPAHVNINELTIMPTAQASAAITVRK